METNKNTNTTEKIQTSEEIATPNDPEEEMVANMKRIDYMTLLQEIEFR